MKKRLLIGTSAIALLFSVSVAHAQTLTVTTDDTENITSGHNVYTSITMDDGVLNITSDASNTSVQSDTTTISGGKVNIKGNATNDTEALLSVGTPDNASSLTISGTAEIDMDWAQIEAFGGTDEAGSPVARAIDIQGGTINMNLSEIHATDDGTVGTNDYTNLGADIKVSDGTINMNNGSTFGRTNSGSVDISGGTFNMNASPSSTHESAIFHSGATGDVNISGGEINLNSNSAIIRGDFDWDSNDQIDITTGATTTGDIVMTGGAVNMNGTSAILFTDNNTGNLKLDGSAIVPAGATPEDQLADLLAKAPKITVNGQNTINSNIDIKDGLLTVGAGAKLDTDTVNLQSGNFGSIIDLAGTLDGDVVGSNKASITFFNPNANITGNVSNIQDMNIRSNLALSNAFGGAVSGTGTVSVYGSTLKMDNANFNSANSLVLRSGSTAILSEDFTTSNKVTLHDNSTLDIGTSTFTTDKFEITDGSTLKIGVNSTTDHGVLAIGSGGSSIEGQANLNVVVANGVLGKGESDDWTLITGISANDFDADHIIANNRYAIVSSGTAGEYTITGTATAEDVVVDAGGTGNNANTASAWLDGNTFTPGTPSADIADHLNDISQNGTDKEFVDALTALAPESGAMIQSVSTETFNVINRAIASRLSGGFNAPVGKSSGDTATEKGAVWVQGLYNYAKLDDTGSVKGFDANTYGLAVGAEMNFTPDVKGGLSYAYTNSDVDGFMRDTDVDTHTAILYGEYKPSNWYVNGIMSYGWSSYDEKRNVGGTRVDADYDANTFVFQAMTGYGFNVGNGFNITPEGGLRYMNIDIDNYTDSAGQRVKSNSIDVLTGIFGVKADKEFAFDNAKIKPEVRLGVTYDFVNDDGNSVVSLANGASYRINGEALDEFGFEFGAGITAELNKQWELSLGYEGKIRSDYQDHTGLLKVKYNF